MWKKQKVKAGVLLYAVTMAAIFSLLLQFYLNRQVAHYQDYALNKEKLVAFAMAKRTKDKEMEEKDPQKLELEVQKTDFLRSNIDSGQLVKNKNLLFTNLGEK